MVRRIFWITAAVLVLAVGGAVAVGWWPVDLPSVATVAGALLALGYAATRSIVESLWTRVRDRLVDRIDAGVEHKRLAAKFEEDYRTFIRNRTRSVDLKGLSTLGFHTPELSRVFVDPGLARRAASQVEEGVVDPLPDHVEDRVSLTELLGRPGPRILGIVGVPGCGKTTLLWHTASTVADGEGPRPVPILLALRDHAATVVADPEVNLAELVRTELGRFATDEPARWFEQRLEQGRCVVLLDGLDEVARRDDRRAVADWIERQIVQYRDNAFVITSRPRGYRKAPVSGAEIFQVRSFTHTQVVEFVHAWYLAAEVQASAVATATRTVNGAGTATGTAADTGSPSSTEDDSVRENARLGADDLLDRLNALPSLYDLTINPLLLTMIANVHRDRGALPGSRSGLYGEICQVVLWKRQEAKRLDVALSGPRKQYLLRGLAFAMMRRQVRDLPRQEVHDEFERMLARMPEDVSAVEVIGDVRHHGLLIERENGLYSFTHHTFQEYLAAAHIRDKELSRILEETVDDPWWRETTVLYAAMADADAIVRACLASGSVAALSLAFDCAEGGRELAPEYRRALDELLASTAVPDTDPELRRVMNRVLLTRHLRTVVRTADGRRVCALPVTVRIHRLFQQDTGAPVFAVGNDDDPVTDVAFTEAVRFTRWINDVTEGEPGYHLPTRAELDDPTVRARLPTCSAWLAPEPGQHRSLLWTPGKTRHPHAVDARNVTEHLTDDLARTRAGLSRLLLLRSVVLLRFLGDARSTNKRLYVDYVDQLDRAFERGSDRVHERVSNVAEELTGAQDVVGAIGADLERTVRVVGSLGAVSGFDHRWALSRIAELKDARLLTEYETELGRDLQLLSRTIWRTVTADRGADPIDRVLAAGMRRARAIPEGSAYTETVEDVLGRASARVLARTLADGDPRDWPERLHRELTRASGIDVDTGEFRVFPDTLENGARNAYATACERLPGTWPAGAAKAFADLALPAFAWPRRGPIAAEDASVVRLSAFLLAAEAGMHGETALRTKFLELAAGVTFLQNRDTEEGSITQTIVLAVA